MWGTSVWISLSGGPFLILEICFSRNYMLLGMCHVVVCILLRGKHFITLAGVYLIYAQCVRGWFSLCFMWLGIIISKVKQGCPWYVLRAMPWKWMGLWRYSFTLSWSQVYMEVRRQLHALAILPLGKEKGSWYWLDRKLGGPQIWSGCRG
jgi:hypothetical protein